MKLENLINKNLILCGTGHRPGKLGGYEKFDFDRLVDFSEEILKSYEPRLIISGMALEWDQALAKASVNLDIPFIAAIPFKGQEITWKREDQERWRFLFSKAAETIIVSSGNYDSTKMQIRNRWMVDNSNAVLALWNGSDSGTGNCVRYAKEKNKKIFQLWDKYKSFKKL